MATRFDIKLSQYIELRGLALQNPNIESTSLQKLCEHYLKCALNKDGQHADYSQDPLPLDIQEYAAIDGLVSRRIHSTICSILTPQLRNTVIEESTGLKDGDEVNLYLAGDTVAIVKILYIVDHLTMLQESGERAQSKQEELQ